MALDLSGIGDALTGIGFGDFLLLNPLAITLTLILGFALTKNLKNVGISQLPLAFGLASAGLYVGTIAMAVYAIVFVFSIFDISRAAGFLSSTFDGSSSLFFEKKRQPLVQLEKNTTVQPPSIDYTKLASDVADHMQQKAKLAEIGNIISKPGTHIKGMYESPKSGLVRIRK